MNAALLCKLKFIYVFVIASVRLLFWDLIILHVSICQKTADMVSTGKITLNRK